MSVYIPFTSSSLMVSNFVLCGIPFLAGFYSRDFTLETFSMRYINMFGFLFVICVYGLDGLLFFPFILFCSVR